MSTKKFEEQILQSLEIVRNKAPSIQLDYFFKIWTEFWTNEQQPKIPYIAVTDVGVSELYIRAAGAIPLFLFGGSYFIDKYTDQIFPQIADPVVKSTSSILLSKKLACTSNISAVAVSVRSVSARKIIPYLRKAGYQVIVMEQEPFLSPKITPQFKFSQMDFLLQLQKITHQPINVKSMYALAEQITRAHDVLQRLDALNIPEITKSFVRQTYYVTTDLAKWIHAVEGLIVSNDSPLMLENQPRLLLIGSPIYFPNVKIHSVLHDVGITNYVNHCGVPYPENYAALFHNDAATANSPFERLHEIHYEAVQDDIAHTLYGNTSFLQNTDGVIYHLLKGQLMYAYEAERAEKAAIRAGVPFVCVETDYTDADTEQIKVRLEAFSELLNQTWQPVAPRQAG